MQFCLKFVTNLMVQRNFEKPRLELSPSVCERYWSKIFSLNDHKICQGVLKSNLFFKIRRQLKELDGRRLAQVRVPDPALDLSKRPDAKILNWSKTDEWLRTEHGTL